MSLDKMDIAGFVFTVVTLVLGLGFVWLFITRRLPPRQVEEIDSALADTVKYLDKLNNSGRTVKNEATVRKSIDGFKERCDGLSADVTREWTELGWKRFLHPRPKALIGPCNILLNEVAKMRKDLIAESPKFKLGEAPPVSNAGPIMSFDNHQLVSPSTSQLSINSSSQLVSNAQQPSMSQPEASPPMPADGSAPSPSGSLPYTQTTASTSHSDVRAGSVPRIIESKQEAVHPEQRDPTPAIIVSDSVDADGDRTHQTHMGDIEPQASHARRRKTSTNIEPEDSDLQMKGEERDTVPEHLHPSGQTDNTVAGKGRSLTRTTSIEVSGSPHLSIGSLRRVTSASAKPLDAPKDYTPNPGLRPRTSFSSDLSAGRP